MKKKLQVFISSTYTDMLEERQAAVEAILASGHIPAGMELFAAGDESQLDIIKKWIDESDVYLLILGGRYGSIEPKSEKSYIQLEYEYAVSRKKPYFSIIIKESALDEKVKKFSKSVLELDNQQKYKEFIKLVTQKMCNFFEDIKDIKIAIFNKMQEYSMQNDLSGWISGRDVKNVDRYADELMALNKENSDLKAKISSLEKRLSQQQDKKGDPLNTQTLHEGSYALRISRVLKLMNAQLQILTYRRFSWNEGEKEFSLNDPEGKFKYYFVFKDKKDVSIDYTLILLINNDFNFNYQEALADIRIMLEGQKTLSCDMVFKYVIANKSIIGDKETKCINFFVATLERLGINKEHFQLEIWNDNNLSLLEQKLGLTI